MTNCDEDIKFNCLGCSAQLVMDGLKKHCSECGRSILVYGNIYDFVGEEVKQGEKDFYDHEYDKSEVVARKETLKELELGWEEPGAPQDALVRKVLGDIKSKIVVMLGNGASKKELSLLQERPKRLVYSDLSSSASMRIKATVDYSGFEDILRFAAIDAEHLPFVNSSVDIIYAYAMVHHLPDLDQFFREVMRVLKPGGKAIFMDDAYCPIWHRSKQTFLKPLMKRSHAQTGISPEDYRFSMMGGFKEEDLSKSIKAVGGEPFFERTLFLGYLVSRAADKLFSPAMAPKIKAGWVQRSAEKIDRLMSVFEFYRRNQIRLVWGFEK